MWSICQMYASDGRRNHRRDIGNVATSWPQEATSSCHPPPLSSRPTYRFMSLANDCLIIWIWAHQSKCHYREAPGGGIDCTVCYGMSYWCDSCLRSGMLHYRTSSLEAVTQCKEPRKWNIYAAKDSVNVGGWLSTVEVKLDIRNIGMIKSLQSQSDRPQSPKSKVRHQIGDENDSRALCCRYSAICSMFL